jgi:hypothetical protein
MAAISPVIPAVALCAVSRDRRMRRFFLRSRIAPMVRPG